MSRILRSLHFTLTFCALVFAPLVSYAQFTVSGRQILNGGKAFTVKGVCYNPTPIGDNGFTRRPNGDYFTSNYAAIQDRDLPLLRKMGANTLRVYGWEPSADHTGFLDKCYNNGVQPLYVLVNYWIDPATDWTNAKAVQTIINQYVQIESKLANHPAVLGVILGNEVNQYNGNGGKAAFWTAMNQIAAAVKTQNPSRLVSIAITDAISHVSAGNATLTKVDFWCMQIYRHPGFGSLFNDYAARSTKPLVLSEFGFDAFDHKANVPYPDNGSYPAAVLVQRWKDISAASAICSGGCVFEYSDEWFKVTTGTDTTHERGGFSTSFPDGIADEEWWGLFAATKNSSGLDTLTPREGYHELAALWNPTVSPQPPIVVGPDTSFETVSLGTTGYYAFAYTPTLPGFTFAGKAGVAGNGSGFTVSNPSAPDGLQVSFVQSQGSITYRADLPAGTYKLTALAANRANIGGKQTVAISVNGIPAGAISSGTSYTSVSSLPFTVTAGTHSITLNGTTTSDCTLLVDKLAVVTATPIVQVPVINAGFEAPYIGTNTFRSYLYTPAVVSGVQSWTFSGAAGIAGNGSGFTQSNPTAPEGTQVAFLQSNTSALSQALAFPENATYVLKVRAAQRGNYSQGTQVVQVLLNGTLVGTLSPVGTQYQPLTVTFTATVGLHTLTLKGTNSADCTALLDQLVVEKSSI